MNEELREQAAAWLNEIECMTLALRFVVQRFASEDEERAYAESVRHFESLMAELQTLIGKTKGVTQRHKQLVRLTGITEPTARAISPLLETILTHEPDFLQPARENGEQHLVALYGMMRGAWGTYVCAPVWDMYPNLAPPGWRTSPITRTESTKDD
jgi:hypothetical protein